MVLTKTQELIWQRSRGVGAGAQAIVLTDPICSYLVGRIALDLGLHQHFPEIPTDLPGLFSAGNLDRLSLPHLDSRRLFERLVSLDRDADMFYACLSTLHKARLKYQRILETQPIPTFEQVGPRGLLQYGQLAPASLAALLYWRKWYFDIDNRAGQETGYLFEPIIAYAVGGTPVPAKKSPVKRHADNRKGRQVDCLLENRAYEFKLRVTIAASGQGRWREELDYPIDCRESGYVPVLVVLDATPNPKLQELERAFCTNGGHVFIGEAAWQHLDALAGPTMSRFLDNYVRAPLNSLLRDASEQLPEMIARMENESIVITIGDDVLRIKRHPIADIDGEKDEMPEDVADDLPA